MMLTVINEIKSSQILLAETSDKGIGIGVEVGFAKALQIAIIYLRSIFAEHSTTVSDISDYHIIYTDHRDIEEHLNKIITTIKQKNNSI